MNETENVNAEVEMPTVVTQEMLDANPELAAAGVQVGVPIGEATDEEVANAIQNGAVVIDNTEPAPVVEETQPVVETAPEPVVAEETPAVAEPVAEPVVETAPEVSEEKKTELEPTNEVGTLPNTTKEQFVAYVEKLKVTNPEEYLRKKAYLDKVLIAYN